ncbi:Uncharacterised protein [Candidatus Bilamarchaeum dharawalense]|uniref:Uncharacterized protein n=1 Tax=Candidatus Bilamarchaeum dharawalense TaxID=2885759 RepID=A0A5E4LSY4_9ARCH|nr:Uncharacterised protein [Candidatus Bilamarchaeum dharawalense]
MKIGTKVGLCAVSILLASAIYGHQRFQFSRYSPAVEVLPKVSVYGVEKADGIVFYANSKDAITTRTVQLLHCGEMTNIIYCKTLHTVYADYANGNLVSVLGRPTIEPRVQLVKPPSSDFLVKPAPLSKDYAGELTRAYLGLKDILYLPEPFEPSCKVPEKSAMPQICSPPKPPIKKTGKKQSIDNHSPVEKEGCQLLTDMENLVQTSNPVHRCMLISVRSLLEHSLENPTSGLEASIHNAKVLIEDVKATPNKQISSVFWRGWDYLFGAVISTLTLALAYFGIRLIIGTPRIRSTSISETKPVVEPGWKPPVGYERKQRLRIMEDKNQEREKTKREYIAELDKLYERLEKVKTLDACGEISGAFDLIEDKVRKSDSVLFKQLQDVRHRFNVALDRKIEFLGGPKAPMF